MTTCGSMEFLFFCFSNKSNYEDTFANNMSTCGFAFSFQVYAVVTGRLLVSPHTLLNINAKNRASAEGYKLNQTYETFW